MPKHSFKRIRRFVGRTVVQRAIHSIAWVIAAFNFGIGITLIITPIGSLTMPTFTANFMFAPPHVWGFGYFVCGFGLMVALTRNIFFAPLALYATTFMVGAWGAFTIPYLFTRDGSFTAIWSYAALGLICLICGWSIETDIKECGKNEI